MKRLPVIFMKRNFIFKLLLTQASLEQSIQLLEAFKNGTLQSNTTNEQLWHAQKIKQVNFSFLLVPFVK